MADLEDQYKQLLQGKKIPILILDNKWHQLFQIEKKTNQIKKLEQELNKLLQRQGKLVNELKDMKRIKAACVKDIVDNMEAAATQDKKQLKKQENNQKMIQEINERTELYEDELLEIPRMIDSVNRRLMIESMDYCYRRMKYNEEKVRETNEWIADVREKLKENIILKKSMETQNEVIYTYMHDVLGPSIVDVFDIKYKGSEE